MIQIWMNHREYLLKKYIETKDIEYKNKADLCLKAARKIQDENN